MAACTALEPMIKATAEEIAAQEFESVVSSHRLQIFRFLLASTRDVDLAVLAADAHQRSRPG